MYHLIWMKLFPKSRLPFLVVYGLCPKLCVLVDKTEKERRIKEKFFKKELADTIIADLFTVHDAGIDTQSLGLCPYNDLS